jgi:hypothetical protein
MVERSLRFTAVLGVEWPTLTLIDQAPVWIKIATLFVAVAVLGVLEFKSWIQSKGPWAYASAISGLILIYIVVCVVGFVESPSGPDAESVRTIAIWGLVAALAFLSAILFYRELRRRSGVYHESPAYVKNINLVAGLTPQTTQPVLLLCNAARTEQHLRIVIDTSLQVHGTSANWTPRRQVVLADLQDVIQEQPISVGVALYSIESQAMWWGNERTQTTHLIQKSTNYRARIRFIGADRKEQTPLYFILIRTSSDSPPYLVNVIRQEDFAFVQEWAGQ